MSALRRLLFPLLLSALAGCGGGGGRGSGTTPPPAPTVTRAEAYRFLTQATFGPTPSDADRVIALGYEGWIDEQLALVPTSHLGYLRALPQPNAPLDDRDAWFKAAVQGRDQLRGRMAFALSQIWVVSSDSGLGEYPQSLAYYYDVLAENAFGNYRTLMEEATLTPEMGLYLSMLGNQKPNAALNIRSDENFARELMQLFTIGLVELEPDGSIRLEGGQPVPTYDQATIEGFAHVFTGWMFGGSPSFARPSLDWLQQMIPFEDFHDAGAKTLLRGETIPAGGTARADLDAALDNIFEHPNVGPFISRQLIQRFVTSNPSPAYVRRVAQRFDDNGQGVRGDLVAVIKAILLDGEARNPPASQAFGKIKEPLLRLTALWRAYQATAASGRYQMPGLEAAFGQAPLGSPSVFNFYRPDHMPPGEFSELNLVAPEMQITQELTSAMTANVLALAVFQWNDFAENLPADAIVVHTEPDLEAAADPAQLVQRVGERLTGSTLSDELREEAEALAASYPADQAAVRLLEVIHLVVTSPEFAVQR